MRTENVFRNTTWPMAMHNYAWVSKYAENDKNPNTTKKFLAKIQHGYLIDVKILEIMLKICSSKSLEKRCEIQKVKIWAYIFAYVFPTKDKRFNNFKISTKVCYYDNFTYGILERKTFTIRLALFVNFDSKSSKNGILSKCLLAVPISFDHCFESLCNSFKISIQIKPP